MPFRDKSRSDGGLHKAWRIFGRSRSPSPARAEDRAAASAASAASAVRAATATNDHLSPLSDEFLQPAPCTAPAPLPENDRSAPPVETELTIRVPIITTTPLSDPIATDGADTPTTGGPRNLWREAYDQMDNVSRSHLDKLVGRPLLAADISQKGVLDELVALMDAKRKKCDDKTWKCKVGDHEIILRDYAVRVTGGLAQAGDVAVEFIPGPAKIVWPLLKGAMTAVAANYDEQMGALLMCTERVVRVVNVGLVYERSYRPDDDGSNKHEDDEATTQLMDDLARLYQTTLEILADVEHLVSKGTCGQTMRAILHPHETAGLFSTLAEREATVDRVAHACGSQMLASIHQGVVRKDTSMQAFFEQQDWSRTTQILDWISTIDYHAQHTAVSRRRTPDTCQWLLDKSEFRSWVDVGASSMLCLQGYIGTGKSFLTSKVVDFCMERLPRSGEEALAFFYCNKSQSSQHDAASILQSFVRQLASHEIVQGQRSLRTQMASAYHKARLSAKRSMDTKDCPGHLLDSVNTFAATTIVLDAFDECDEDARTELMDVFEHLAEEAQRPVKIFISSRPPEVQDFSCPRITIAQSDNSQDIAKYIQSEIAGRRAPKSVKSMKDEILRNLLGRSQSMFRWAELQLKHLFRCSSEEAIRDRLQNMPETLTDLYEELYQEICDRNIYDRQRVDDAIMWVLFLQRPLDVDEILSVICINTDIAMPEFRSKLDKDTVLALCNDLLVIDEESNTWRFPHASVLEFFEAQTLESGRPNRHRAEIFVATACLRILNNYTDHVQRLGPKLCPGPSLPQNDYPLVRSYIIDFLITRWTFCIRKLEEREAEAVASSSSPLPVHSIVVEQLKLFLGPPMNSSEQYRAWMKDAERGQSISRYPRGKHATFLMAHNGIYDLLRDWWNAPGVADVVRRCIRGESLFLLACESGSISLLRYLLSTLRPGDGRSIEEALLYTACNGRLPVLQFLVEDYATRYGFKGDEKLPGKLLVRAADGMVDDFWSGYDHIEIVRYLIQRFPMDVNEVVFDRSQYRAPLVSAGTTERLEIVALLIDAGADVNIVLEAPSRGSPLAEAVCNYRPELVSLLIDRGADVNMVLPSNTYPSALFAALDRLDMDLDQRNKDTFVYLVSRGGHIRSVLESGLVSAPKLARAMCHHEPLLERLLDEKANVTRVVQEGILVPLLQAAITGKRGMYESDDDSEDSRFGTNDDEKQRCFLKSLVAAGCDVDAPIWTSPQYGSCLELAAFEGRMEHVTYLVDKAQASVNLAPKQGMYGCALGAAAASNRLDVLSFLLERGADPNQRPQDDCFGTPLMLAAFGGRYGCVEALLHAGADVDLQIEDDSTHTTGGTANRPFHNALEAALAAPTGENAEEDLLQNTWNEDERSDQHIREDRGRVVSLLQSWESSRGEGQVKAEANQA